MSPVNELDGVRRGGRERKQGLGQAQRYMQTKRRDVGAAGVVVDRNLATSALPERDDRGIRFGRWEP